MCPNIYSTLLSIWNVYNQYDNAWPKEKFQAHLAENSRLEAEKKLNVWEKSEYD